MSLIEPASLEWFLRCEGFMGELGRQTGSFGKTYGGKNSVILEHARETHEVSLIVQLEGNRDVQRREGFFNLDAIISVSYQVKRSVVNQFCFWATQQLAKTSSRATSSKRDLATCEIYLLQIFATSMNNFLTKESNYGII